jgi:hypothetical protein
LNYNVTKVRKERANGGTHEHIEGVCIATGNHYTRAQVVASINNGDIWTTSAGGRSAVIRPITYCPASGCLASPYITTRPDTSKDDNLENLPRC